MDQPPYTSADFQEDAHKQVAAAAAAAVSATHLSWAHVAPLLDAARALCRDDMRFGGGLALHGLEYAGAELAPAEEAYLSVTARDRDTNVEWLSQTYWLSALALADRDPERVRSAIAAMERSIAKLRAWLEENDQAAGANDLPPADQPP